MPKSPCIVVATDGRILDGGLAALALIDRNRGIPPAAVRWVDGTGAAAPPPADLPAALRAIEARLLDDGAP